ncbi:MAG: hypothetical protein JSV02_10565 [Dehalococcoidia bacterium]|nr:MAG: hypothetical protein JSV02_10565 [Dehalococcoidia bacterium]
MTFAAIYAIVVGFAMIGYWGISISRRQVPEFRTEPIRITFHVAAEGVTAIALLLSGFGLLFDTCWGLETYLVALGMLFYTLIVSPGYFAQKGKWPMVCMFAVLIILGIVSLVLIFR